MFWFMDIKLASGFWTVCFYDGDLYKMENIYRLICSNKCFFAWCKVNYKHIVCYKKKMILLLIYNDGKYKL